MKKHSDDDDAEGAEMARMEDQIDKLEGEDDSTGNDAGANADDEDDEDSFIQTQKHSDDDDSESTQVAGDKGATEGAEEISEDDEDSFIQMKKHNDDDDAEGAEMARMEDQIDKLEGEDDSTGNAATDEEDEESD